MRKQNKCLVCKDIIRVKKLVSKYKGQLVKQPLVENFGQSLVRKLRDEFADYRYSLNDVAIEINSFDEWCQNWTGPKK